MAFGLSTEEDEEVSMAGLGRGLKSTGSLSYRRNGTLGIVSHRPGE